MALTKQKLIHKRTAVEGKIPTIEQLALGEIAINMSSGSTRLYTRRTDDTIAEFYDNNYISGTYATIVDLVDDEEVVAAALNVLNDKIDKKTFSDSATTYEGHYVPSASTTAGTEETSASTAIKGIKLDGKGHICEIITGDVLGEAEEEVFTAAIADIYEKLGNIPSGQTYSDSATTYEGHFTPTGTTTVSGGHVTGITMDGKGHVTNIATATTAHTHTIGATGDTWISVTGGSNSVQVNHAGPGTASTTAGTEVASASTSIKGIKLDAKGHIVEIISGDTMGEAEEKAIAAALNDLNTRKQDKVTLTAGDGTSSEAYYVTGHNNNTGDTTSLYIFTGVSIYDNSVHAAQGFYQNSDEKLKTFESDIEVDFNKIKEIPKKYFYWNADEVKVKREIGTSAQKVKELYPELVAEDSNEILNMSYDKLSIIALAAIDKLNERLEKLEKENEKLKNALAKKK